MARGLSSRVYPWANDRPGARKPRGSEIPRPSPEIEKRLESTTLRYIRPNKSDVFWLVENPFYASTLPLRMVLQYQAVGLGRANMHSSIFLMAHLYNGVRKLNLLGAEWPVMKRIIDLHKRMIFANAAPATPQDMASRLIYHMDSPTLRGPRKDGRWRKDLRWYLKPHPATDLVQNMLSNDPRDRARGLWQLNHQSDSSSHADKTESRQNRSVNAQSYVRDLQIKLQSMLDDLSIDYICLTKECT